MKTRDFEGADVIGATAARGDDAALWNDSRLRFLYPESHGHLCVSRAYNLCAILSHGVLIRARVDSSYATNTTLPISKTYSSGRAAVALSCGPTFAPVVSAVTSTSSARSMRIRLDGVGMAAAAAAVVWMPFASMAVPFLLRLS